jgi:cell division protein FtsN
MSSTQYPGWAYLLAGLVMGLFIAFLVYLQNLPEPAGHRDISGAAAQPEQNGKQAAKPQFDFYKILPELEVVVPALEVKSRQEQSRPTPPTPTEELAGGEKFVLQVGSFKQFDQADKLKASLALLGITADIQQVSVDRDTWHRVRVGPFKDRNSLNVMRRRLQDNDINAITLKVSG